MARLWSTGFELQSVATGVEFDANSGTPTIDTTTFRSGVAALRCNAAGTAKYIDHKFQADIASVKFFRFYFRFPTAPSVATRLFQYGNGAGTYGGGLRINTSRQLTLYDTGTGLDVATGTTALATGTWYRVELRMDDSTATNTGTLLLDGNSEIAQTNFTTDVGGGGRLNLGVRTNTTFDCYYDDVAVNDASGSFQNTYPGDGKIIHLQPNGTGDANAWGNTSGGVAGAANNYTRVLEVTPDDVTTFNGSGTLNQEELYNVTDSGIGGSDAVNVVSVGARFRNSAANATTAVKFEIEKTSGGTILQSSAYIPNSTTWKTNGVASPFVYPITTYQDPDNASWTQTTLDSMQIGCKMTAIGSFRVDVSTIWALVDYTPGGAPPPSDPAPLRAMMGIGT